MDWIRDLFTTAPWPLRAIGWIVALVILWLMVAFPAWLLSRPLSETYRILREVAGRLWSRVQQVRQTARVARTQKIAEIVDSQRYVVIKESRMNGWHAAITQALLPIERLLSSITNASRDLADLETRLRVSDETNGLVSSATTITQAEFGAAPDSQLVRTRIALFLLPVFALILVSLIAVNTGMLSQILRDAGIVPARTYLGVPLATVFAAILTLIEASTGFLYGFLGVWNEPAPGMPRRFSIGRFFALLGAIAIAFVEGYFYSRIGSTEQLSGLTGLPLTAEQIFLLWGFVLVMCLFGFGHACFEAATTLIRGHALSAYARALKARRKEADSLRRDSKTLQGLIDSVQQQVRDIREHMKIGDEAGPLKSRLDTLRDDLRRIRDEPVTTGDDDYRVAPTDVDGLADRITVWCVLGLFSAAACWAAGTIALSGMFPSWSASLQITSAMGAMLLMVVVGLTLRTADKYLLQTGGALVPVMPIRASTRFAVVRSVATIMLLAAVPLVASRRPLSALAAWLFAIVAGGALMLVAHELSRAFFIIGLLWRRAFSEVGALLIACIAIVISLTVVLLATVLWAVNLLAEPARVLLGYRRPKQTATVGAHV